ncbi:YbaB/EbfC family DNA-binding protein [Mycolicibacterium sphagni]|uniref:YbaB/EbfC family DNA-binding protein n=1 Tax=Mycolicibacterium sphagni TaxID=1786 RepID=A0ABX2JXZ8_9MYCO|nr:YbaB/EbfC family DNA-binding protein [Mycolicibacterium sphagni]NTY60689.1 YbaB/EbfC family DNA-binding protein [Mycolicibacterium sphagni]
MNHADSTDRDDFAALDFTVDDDLADETGVDALDEYTPAEPEVAGAELEAQDEDDDDTADDGDILAAYTRTVTNPAGTVSVSALIDGSVRQIDLSPAVTKLSESQLIDEILVLAHLAQQQGLAGQHSYLRENEFVTGSMDALGVDGDDLLRDLMENGMGLPTPEQAAAEQAEVFAARYAGDND